MPPILHAALLGPPIITGEGKPLPMLRRQTRALLYCLAADLQPIARAQLCFYFWPDVADAVARRNLTRLLVLLRQSLPHPSLLLVEDETVRLDGQQVWSDTAHFISLTTVADVNARRTLLAQAVELWRGPFLNGFSLADSPEFETWMESARRIWERRYLDTLAMLVEAHSAAREYAAAITYAQRYLQQDELAEEIHRRLIMLLGATGERTAALRQFEQCAVSLERELGVSPLAETRAVFEMVRDGMAIAPPHPAEPVPLLPLPPVPVSVTAHASPSSIPVPTSPLIGRAAKVAEIIALLQRGDVRLLTLSGPGGAGKTRLAIEVARQVANGFTDGAAFVPLAPLRDPAHVIPAIMQSLGLRDQDERPPLVRLQDALRERDLLLVLDNFEHVAAAAVEIARLLAVSPRLRVLTTSRILLRLAGETSYHVPPLELVDPAQLPALDSLAQVESIALYLARVRARLPKFQLTEANQRDIAAICARLDGLPLAIELAAARAELLSPRMLLARLNRRLAILTEGPYDLPERQRTLRATIDWSYRLLDLSEQELFVRLAIFAGSWNVEAAEALCEQVGLLAMSTLDGLQALLDKHLIARVESSTGEPRFSMLETIREFALEQLTARGEAAAVERVYADYYLALAEAAVPALRGPEQIRWFEILDDEHANLRVVLAWFFAMGNREQALRLAIALFWFWHVRSYFSEGRAWLERILASERAGEPVIPPLLLAQAHFAIGQLAIDQGDPAAAQPHSEQSLQLWRAVERNAAGDATYNVAHAAEIQGATILAIARVLQAHGMQGDHSVNEALVPEINARTEALNDPWFNALITFEGGFAVLENFGDISAAQAALLPAQQMFRELGDAWHQAQVMVALGLLEMLLGNPDDAAQWYEQALTAARALKERAMEAVVLEKLGEVARWQGADGVAADYYAASLRLFRELDSRLDTARLAHNFGYLALHQGDRKLARQRFLESMQGFRTFGQPRGLAEALAGLAAVTVQDVQDVQDAAVQDGTATSVLLAARYWGAASAIHQAEGTPVWPANRVEIDRYQALARKQIGDAAFDAAYAEGALADATQLVAAALRV